MEMVYRTGIYDPDCGGEYAYSDGVVYLLTPCCKASGKGSIGSFSGVVCRKCRRDVSYEFGMGWTPESIEAEGNPELTKRVQAAAAL